MTRSDGTTEGTTTKKSVVPPIVSAIHSDECRQQLCVVVRTRVQLVSGAEYGALELPDPRKGRRHVPPSPPPVHRKREGVSDPTRRLQSRPPRPAMGSLTPSVSASRNAVVASVLAGELSLQLSDRRRTGPNRPAKGEPSCARIMRNIARPLVPLTRQLACGGCVRPFGRPPRLSILERHARASSLGAPRRPVRAAGLTRARLAPLGGYVMAGRCVR
jgi:hypothetical protein